MLVFALFFGSFLDRNTINVNRATGSFGVGRRQAVSRRAFTLRPMENDKHREIRPLQRMYARGGRGTADQGKGREQTSGRGKQRRNPHRERKRRKRIPDEGKVTGLGEGGGRLEVINRDAVNEYHKNRRKLAGWVKPDPDEKYERRLGEDKEMYEVFQRVVNANKEGYQGPGSEYVSVSRMMDDPAIDSASMVHEYIDDESLVEDPTDSKLSKALQLLETEGKGAFIKAMKDIYGEKAEQVIKELKQYRQMQKEGALPSVNVDPVSLKAPVSRPGKSYTAKPKAKPKGEENTIEKASLKAKPDTPRMKFLKKAIEMEKAANDKLIGSAASPTLPMPLIGKPSKSAPVSAAASDLPMFSLSQGVSESANSLPGFSQNTMEEEYEYYSTEDEDEEVKPTPKVQLTQVSIPPKRRGKKGKPASPVAPAAEELPPVFMQNDDESGTENLKNQIKKPPPRG